MSERRVATYQDVIDAPPFKVAEIVGGELFVSPRPRPWACFAKTRLGSMLGAELMLYRGVEDGWFILNEPELRLGGDVLVPDIAGWRRTRMPYMRDDDEDDEGYDSIDDYPVVPDWVCEIADPSTPEVDARKLPVYAAAGIQHLWLVDPKRGRLETFQLRDGRWAPHATYRDGAIVRAAPFEEVAVELGRVSPSRG